MTVPTNPKPVPTPATAAAAAPAVAPPVLPAAANTPPPSTDPPPAEPTTQRRRIRDGVFWYAFPDTPGQGLAYRGEIVDLLPVDVARGEKHGSFMPTLADEPAQAGGLAAVPDDGTDAEFDSLVLSGTVPEIVDYVNGNPGQADKVLAAEERRGSDARTSLLASIATLVDSRR